MLTTIPQTRPSPVRVIDFSRSTARTVRWLLHFAVILTITFAGLPVARAQFFDNFLCAKTDPRDHAELQQLVRDDQRLRQGDRTVPRDEDRLARVLKLYHADSIQTAADFANAALILQHGYRPEDYLTAQEFTTTAVGLGCGGMLGLFAGMTEYRWLASLGLNPEFIDGEPNSENLTITPSASSFSSVPLTLELVTQARGLREQLHILQQQHPEYSWRAIEDSSPIDTLTAFAAHTPAVAAAFAQAHLTPQQWRDVTQATQSALDNAFVLPIVPKPIASDTGALWWSKIAQGNLTFVLTHQAELRHLGYDVDFMDPVSSELARTHLAPVVLPPDTRASTWSDPCPTAGHDTLRGSPALLQLRTAVSHAGGFAKFSDSAEAWSPRVRALLQQYALTTLRDSMWAAILLENSVHAEDVRIAEDLAVAGVVAGCGIHAMQIAAASEDRFLALLGLQQRFGTLPSTLVPIDKGPLRVTNGLRHILDLPSVPSVP